MARRDPAPVWFQTRVSRRLILYLAGAHGSAALALWLAVLPVWGKAVIGVLLLASFGHGMWVHGARRSRYAVRAVHWQADGQWRVLDGRGSTGLYHDQRVVLAEPSLILVRLTGMARRRWLLLAPDSAEGDALRRLRVRLRRVSGTEQGVQAGSLSGT